MGSREVIVKSQWDGQQMGHSPTQCLLLPPAFIVFINCLKGYDLIFFLPLPPPHLLLLSLTPSPIFLLPPFTASIHPAAPPPFSHLNFPFGPSRNNLSLSFFQIIILLCVHSAPSTSPSLPYLLLTQPFLLHHSPFPCPICFFLLSWPTDLVHGIMRFPCGGCHCGLWQVCLCVRVCLNACLRVSHVCCCEPFIQHERLVMVQTAIRGKYISPVTDSNTVLLFSDNLGH